jgi:hypothetical protein
MPMPIRNSTHRIDTRAGRRLLQALPPDVLVREMSDRDYGIDLALEVWDGKSPTGQFVFLQCKGKEKQIRVKDGEVVFGIPRKTLCYAEKFVEPFFLAYTSLEDGAVYFLWLQKYAQLRLDLQQPNWREAKGKINVKIPARNRLDRDDGKALFMERCAEAQLPPQSVQFLGALQLWRLHSKHWLFGNQNVLEPAVEALRKMALQTAVLSRFQYHGQKFEAVEAALREKRADAPYWEDFNTALRIVEIGVLNSADLEALELELTNAEEPRY